MASQSPHGPPGEDAPGSSPTVKFQPPPRPAELQRPFAHAATSNPGALNSSSPPTSPSNAPKTTNDPAVNLFDSLQVTRERKAAKNQSPEAGESIAAEPGAAGPSKLSFWRKIKPRTWKIGLILVVLGATAWGITFWVQKNPSRNSSSPTTPIAPPRATIVAPPATPPQAQIKTPPPAPPTRVHSGYAPPPKPADDSAAGSAARSADRYDPPDRRDSIDSPRPPYNPAEPPPVVQTQDYYESYRPEGGGGMITRMAEEQGIRLDEPSDPYGSYDGSHDPYAPPPGSSPDGVAPEGPTVLPGAPELYQD